MNLIKRIFSAWRRYSIATFLDLVAKNAIYYLREIFSGRLFFKLKQISKYDVSHNVETEKIREIGSLSIESANVKHANRYQASPQEYTSRIIQSLQIDHRQFAFLDFGAGKGRVLLIAAQLPFASVVGIEFSKELCDIANNNIRRLSIGHRTAIHVECQHEDAALYSLPTLPLVCYFYNPFDGIIMQAVMDRLASSLKEHPREIYIIYVEPKYREIFDTQHCFDVLDQNNFHIIYRANLNKHYASNPQTHQSNGS